MKLAFIAPGHPYRGGIANFATRLAQQLNASHECRYINFTRLYPGLFFPGKTQFDSSRTVISFPSERIIDSIVPFSWSRAGRTVREWGADALIFHWWHPFFAPSYRGVLRSAGKNIISICICHNVSPHEKGMLWRKAVKYGIGGMDGFVIHAVPEESELDRLIPGNKHKTLFHPVYDIFPGEDISKADAREKLGLDEDDRVVLYFGLIRPYKGVEVLLRAASKLHDVSRLKLLVVGEIYSNRQEIQRLIQGLPHDMVRLVDEYIPNEDVSAWFRAADIVALPYLSATQSGIVPIAYRCLRPVIVTRVGGLPDAVEDGESGYLIEPDNAEQLADTIRDHFIKHGNPDMSTGIDHILKRLSWERYAEELVEFISQLSK